MQLTLTTLLGTKVDRIIYEIIVPTVDGEIAIFPGHEPLVTLTELGVITIRNKKSDSNDELEYLAITKGIIKISQKNVDLLVDEADHGRDISEKEVKLALERAIKMRDEAKDQVELDEAHQLVNRHTVRLKVAELQRRHRLN